MCLRASAPGRSRVVSVRVVAFAVTVVMVTTFSVGHAQAPRTTGLPGSADRAHNDPCERAVRPHGQSLGLQAHCEPLGGGGAAKGDFDADGIGDLAVGVPGEDIGSIVNAGVVHVIYGAGNGLSAEGSQLIHQNISGVNGSAGTGDNFGWAIAAGHFNNDSYSDLAVGVPNEDLGGFANVGAVQVFYGSATGLRLDSSQQFWDYQDLPGAFEIADGADSLQFGYALVWADFNGDERGDLVVGAPGAGDVVVLPGSGPALTFFDAREIDGAPEHGHGLVLSAGDYDGDGFDDLAVGMPYTAVCPTDVCLFGIGLMEQAGAVRVYRGSPIGVLGLSDLQLAFLTQPRVGCCSPEPFDRFGSSLTSGDFNADGLDDLAVGVAREDLGAKNADADAGFVHVYLGDFSAFGLVRRDLFQASPAAGDKFGFALAAGDFNGDGFDDLAVGVPGEDVGSAANAGIVQVFPGSAVGVEASSFQIWHQDVSGILNAAEAGDQFGFALSAWNFGKGPYADLAIGIPFEDVFDLQFQTAVDAGAVHVIYGSAIGLAATGNQLWTQNHVSGDGAEPDDGFGRAVY